MITVIFIIITVIYLILIFSFVRGFNKVEVFNLQDINPKSRFSILIPFKNEAKNLPALVDSISKLNYPKHLFEVIFINDNSADDSKQILSALCKKHLRNYVITVIDNERKSKAPKKDAITLGVSKANFEWIVTTDADCLLPKYWLDSFDEFIQNSDSDVIAGPLLYATYNTFLERFQAMDVMSLQGATIGAFGLNNPFMCNGANFAYKATTFETLNGFEGNTNIASGDDIFFLEKAKRKGHKVDYLKSVHAAVISHPEPNWNAVIVQRKRWASKTSATKNTLGRFTALVILLMNAAIACGLVLAMTSVISWKLLLYLFFIKINIDFLLLFKTASFFDTKDALSSYWLACLLYPFFSTYVAIVSMFSTYKWKGEHYSK
ncbi:glycosyltransferase [Winogradskyella sp. 3972H.M.0a.05]|uniref:glycosyltransferase n=1 Tax=Winogradskyella sp. 3972H.M.0a.05 TaxID=2950277 RepID=UPI00339A2897